MSKSTFTARFETLLAEIRVDGSRPKHIEKAMRRERRMGVAKGRREALAMKAYTGKESDAAFALLTTSEKISRSLSDRLADANGTISRLERELAEKTKTLEHSANVIESQKWQLDTVARALGYSASAHKTLGGAIDGIRANESRLQREVAKLERELAKTGKSTTIVEANDSIEVGDRFEWKDNPAGAFRIDSIAREVVYVYETTSATGHKTGSRSMNAAQAHIRAGRWVRLEKVDGVKRDAATRVNEPILPSSLKVGQRIEWTQSFTGMRRRGVVCEVHFLYALANTNDEYGYGVNVGLGDQGAESLAIRILDDVAQTPRIVRLPYEWDYKSGGHSEECYGLITDERDGTVACLASCPAARAWEAAGCPK